MPAWRAVTTRDAGVQRATFPALPTHYDGIYLCATGLPQCAQNLACGSRGAPHAVQKRGAAGARVLSLAWAGTLVVRWLPDGVIASPPAVVEDMAAPARPAGPEVEACAGAFLFLRTVSTAPMMMEMTAMPAAPRRTGAAPPLMNDTGGRALQYRLRTR